jgi:serine/threonine-protein kinase RsbW
VKEAEETGKELKVNADLEAMDKVRSFLRRTIARLDLAEEDGFKIELSLHEICVNIVRYAYRGEEEGEIVLRTWVDRDKLFFEIRDTGVPFDPRRAVLPDIWEKIRNGTRGGFGIFLYRILMDGYHYRRNGGENVLTVFKYVRRASVPHSV